MFDFTLIEPTSFFVSVCAVMRNRFGAKIIIAVDVSGDWNMNASQSYGDSLNGLSVWASRWNPFAEKIQNVRDE